VLFSPVFAVAHLRRSPRSPNVGTCQRSNASTCLDLKSHGIISFTDPHPLTPSESYRFKNSAGRVYSPCLNPFSCNIYGLPASVANKRLTAWLSPLHATLTKNTGGTPNSPGKEEFYRELRTERGARRSQTFSQSAKIDSHGGGDTVSTEAVAARRHAGTHLPVTWWKLEMPTTTWHLQLN
jgi:hypothetical protein